MELPKKGMQGRLLLGSGHCTDLRSMHDVGFHVKPNKSFGEHEWSNNAQAFQIHTCMNYKRNAELGCRPSQFAVTAHSKNRGLFFCAAQPQQRVCFECLREAVQSGLQAQ